ncbi:MAG TPA: hypothetical protein VK892_10845 [Pyrinomonadaceae bacterium]|nr:hypothetical protein [Pyrinomonadaceae bacterium]
MNTNDLGIFLALTFTGIINLVLFIYLKSFNFFKIPTQIPQGGSNSNGEGLKADITRRKVESKPTIICSLPIHQEGRKEAPLY